MIFEIITGKGIENEGKFVLLGSPKEEIQAILGTPSIIRNSFYYYQNELRIDFDENGCAEFIEFLGGIDGNLKPHIYGINIFETLHDIVYGKLLEKNGKEPINIEDGHCYDFSNIGVSLYREITPKELLENVKAMEAEGIPFENYVDYASDKRRALHWGTVGIK
jgi:hypothetical protein